MRESACDCTPTPSSSWQTFKPIHVSVRLSACLSRPFGVRPSFRPKPENYARVPEIWDHHAKARGQQAAYMVGNLDLLEPHEFIEILLSPGPLHLGWKSAYFVDFKINKSSPPWAGGREGRLLFFHCREWDQLIPWLTPRWPLWGPFWVNHGWKKQKFSFPLSCSGGELLFLFKSVKYALFHPRWHYLLVILICLELTVNIFILFQSLACTINGASGNALGPNITWMNWKGQGRRRSALWNTRTGLAFNSIVNDSQLLKEHALTFKICLLLLLSLPQIYYRFASATI